MKKLESEGSLITDHRSEEDKTSSLAAILMKRTFSHS